MTSTAAIVYGGVLFTIVVTYFLGRSLDSAQSNNHATWKTGCIGMKTVLQSVVLGAVVGPLVYLLKGGNEELWVCVLGMMAAPFVVDLLRPTVTLHPSENGVGEPLPQKFVNNLNMANALAILICVVAIVAFVCWSLMR